MGNLHRQPSLCWVVWGSHGANAVIRIVNPKTARLVAPVMEYNQEGEHISMPGTRYRLVDVQEKGEWSRKLNDYVPKYTFEEISE